MKITITPSMLCDLCGGKFTLEACEALCSWFDGMCGDDFAPAIGDIYVSFTEVDPNWMEEGDEEKVVAYLKNGNVVLMQ